MDDDEPIYRRYFSYINDKLMYPIKIPYYRHPLINEINDFLPEPLLMDRRYHISPPGETTQYRVEENYLDYDIVEKNDRMISKEAQLLAYKKVIEICYKSTSGEILFFANGKKEILEAVEYLNKNMPDGNIALPFFSELNETYKSIITKIDIKISQIKNKRENIHNEWNETYIEDLSVPSGVYKRAVIIATNVAEASITIPRLAYVIDNGFAKVNVFKPEINTTVLEVQPISEASRLQRKGRVGRIGDGTVYYMYKRDARKFIKPKYKITQEDVALAMLGLLCEKKLSDVLIDDFENNNLILSKTFNPNVGNIKDETSGLTDIYKENYLINYDNKILEKYKDTNMENSMFVFNSGQIIQNILDNFGQFYLIHPFENSIKRNVLNKIIKYDKFNTNIIPQYAYKFILFLLFNKNLLADYNGNVLYQYVTDINNENRNFLKTELAKYVQEVSSTFKTNINDSITLISASCMNCLTEVYDINMFINIMGSMKNLTNSDWNIFKQTWYDPKIKSDLIFIYNLINSIKSTFGYLNAFNINSQSIQLKLNQISKNILDNFIKLKEKYNEPPEFFDAILWNKLSTLKNNGKLLSDYKSIILNDTKIIEFINEDIKQNEEKIINWSKNNLLNDKLIISFIKQYAESRLTIFTDENIKIFNWTTNLRSNFYKNLSEHSLNEKIIRSFVYGQPLQYTYSINNNSKFLTLQNFNHFIVKFAEPRFYKKNELINETMTKLSNEFTFYLKFEQVENPNSKLNYDDVEYLNVFILSQIDITYLLPAIPLIINPILIPDKILVSGILDNIEYLTYSKSNIINPMKNDIINKWNNSIIIWDSDQTPILRDFYRKIYKFITSKI
jgi:hypothetical protein